MKGNLSGIPMVVSRFGSAGDLLGCHQRLSAKHVLTRAIQLCTFCTQHTSSTITTVCQK